MYHNLKRNNSDVVIASAYHKHGKVLNVPFNKLIKSYLINKFYSIISPLKINTFTCIVRGYKEEVIKKFKLSEYDKEIHLQIILEIIQNNIKVIEIPAILDWGTINGKNSRDIRYSQNRFVHLEKNIIFSHFSYAFFMNPNFFIFIPFILTFLSTFITFGIILNSIFILSENSNSIISAISLSFQNGPATYFAFSLSLILTMGLVILFFLSSLLVNILKIAKN